jgi:hypothetical protein
MVKLNMPVINYNFTKKEFVLRSIKIFDVAILTILYFVIGYILSWIINKMYYNFDETEYHNKFLVFLEICAQVAILGILIYLIRNFINILPFPFQGIYGYEHKNVKELQSGGVAVAFGVFYAQENIKTKLNYVFY